MSRLWIVSYGMNQVLPRQRWLLPPLCQRAMFDCVLVAHADRPAVERRPPVVRELEHELVAVVDEAGAVDRLVVADREVAVERGAGAGRVPIDGDRLDPVDGVLEGQVAARGLGHVQRRPGIGGLGADIEEERPVPARVPAPRRRSRRWSTPGTPAAAWRRDRCGTESPGCTAGKSRSRKRRRARRPEAPRGSRHDRSEAWRR